MALRLNKTSTIFGILTVVVLSGALGYLLWRVNQPQPLSTADSEAASTYCVDAVQVFKFGADNVVCSDCFAGNPKSLCPTSRTFSINPTNAGKYKLTGVVGRGHCDGDVCQCQSEEEFRIVIDGVKGLVVPDDYDTLGVYRGVTGTPDQCPETTIEQELGVFDLKSGSTTVKMVSTAPSCSDGKDYPANSVHLVKICLYPVQACGNGVLESGEQCETGNPTGSSCTWDDCNQTSCTCRQLTITKTVAKSCLNTDTDNPIAELTYTITMKNADPKDNRTVTKVKDVLDPKILAAGIVPTGITSPGAYSNGNIVWKYDTTNLIIKPGESKVLTYKVNIDKDHYGEYTNTVTMTRESGVTSEATATILADCSVIAPLATCGDGVLNPGESCELGNPEGTSCEWDSCNQSLCVCIAPSEPVPVVPQTGIFDSTLGRIGVGLALLIVGGIVYTIPNRMLIVNKRENTYKYRGRFEKRVANR